MKLRRCQHLNLGMRRMAVRETTGTLAGRADQTGRGTTSSRRAFLVRVMLLLTLIAAAYPESLVAQTPTPALREVDVCVTTTNGYTAKVCLTAPDPETPVTEDPTISATVEISDPKIQVVSVSFALKSRNVLTDGTPPYEFVLRVANWPDGVYKLSATARLSDKTKTDPVETPITLYTGTTAPPVAADTFRPTAGRPAAGGEPFVLAAVGDGAGGSPESEAVVNEISAWDPNLFLYLGDVYDGGLISEFTNWYAPDRYFGRFKSITDPTIGNHEYSSKDGPQGYLHYWGNPPHYYSVDTAGWHLISLDTNTDFNETDPASEQMTWLQQDLESSSAACTLVFYHQPRYNVGSHGDDDDLDALWKLLVQHDVTLVLNGHDHNYQRWQAMDGNGKLDPHGTTEVIVGTGGQSEYPVSHDDPRLATDTLFDPGALRVELNEKGAAMQFITTDGIVHDSTVVPCDRSGATSDTTPPTAPGTPTAIRAGDGTVTVSWAPSQDETGVASYDVYRNGKRVGSVHPMETYIDRDASPTGPSLYTVVARDAAGNQSPASAETQASGTVDPNVLFVDTFASDSLARWSSVSGLVVEPGDGESPEALAWVARARGGTAPAYARKTLFEQSAPPNPLNLQVTVVFRVLDQGDNPVVLSRLRTPQDDTLFGLSIGTDGKLGLFNDITHDGKTSKQQVSRNRWHQLVYTVSGQPGALRLDVSLDGDANTALSGPIDLQKAKIGIVQLGDSTGNRVYDVQYRRINVQSMSSSATPVASPIASPAATPGATPVASPLATSVATPIMTPAATPIATPAASPVAAASACLRVLLQRAGPTPQAQGVADKASVCETPGSDTAVDRAATPSPAAAGLRSGEEARR